MFNRFNIAMHIYIFKDYFKNNAAQHFAESFEKKQEAKNIAPYTGWYFAA